MSNQGYRLSKRSWNNYHDVMFDYGSDMLTLCPSKAIIPWLRQEKTSINPNAVPNRILGMSFQNKPSISHNHLWNFCGQGALTSGISNYTTLKRWLICASIDDEYRSSRNIAISLLRRYRSVVDRGGGDNLKEFINAGVNAYALGCTDESLRKELLIMKKSGVGIEENYGGKTSLKFRILLEEVDECILWLGIIFITILCTPQPTIMRWSSSSPVSPETLSKWKGFCALIANAYYMKGMAWLPVKTLQLEQMAVLGKAEKPSVVASRMRLVFSTLEVVSPQWPRV